MTKDQFIRENLDAIYEAKKLAHDGVAGAIDAMHGLYQKHPVAVPLAAAAGAAGIGALHHQHKQKELAHHQQQAFHQAMELFPELHSENPEKLRMLWGSALQVAPNMAKNPLLLGSWIKGLAKGYSGTHIGPQDLKQLQELETGLSGQAPRRDTGAQMVGHVMQGASGLGRMMGSMGKGQGGY